MELKEQLEAIHRGVLNRFVYRSDELEWGMIDHWESEKEIPDEGEFVGDCDGFALACRKECRKLDINSRLVFCQVETGGYHLVLEVDGWILDNRMNWVVSRDDIVDYKWLSISGYKAGDSWFTIRKPGDNNKHTL